MKKKLLLSRHLQCLNNPRHTGHNDHIRDNIVDCVSNPESSVTDTMPMILSPVPHVRDWVALEDCDQDGSNGVAEHNSTQTSTGVDEPALRSCAKDTQVNAYHGKFGAVN